MRINFTIGLWVLQCYVWSVLLYGCETWTILKVMKDRLMAVEVWFLRRMLKILWTEKKSNEETVFKEAKVHRTLMKRIRQWQLAFLGHELKKHGLENLVVTRKIDGRKARERQRLKYLDSFCVMGESLKTSKLSRYITNTKVNSTFHPSGVGKSSTSLSGWG